LTACYSLEKGFLGDVDGTVPTVRCALSQRLSVAAIGYIDMAKSLCATTGC